MTGVVGAFGNALLTIGGNLAEQERVEQRAADTALVSRVVRQGGTSFQSAYDAAIESGYSEDVYRQKAQSSHKTLLAALPKHLRDEGNRRMQEVIENGALQLGEARRKKHLNDIDVDLATEADTLSGEYLNAIRSGNAEAEVDTWQRLNAVVTSRHLQTPQQHAAYLKSVKEQGDTQFAMGGLERELQDGGVAAARAYIDAYRESDQVVDPIRRDKTVAGMEAYLRDYEIKTERVKAEQKAKIDAENNRVLNVAEVQISRGQMGHEGIEELVDKGFLTVGSDKWRQLTLKVDKVAEDGIKIAQARSWAEGVTAGTVRPDPGNKDYVKGVNASYGDWLNQAAMGDGLNVYEINAQTAQMVKKWGVVPEQVKANIRQLQTGAPQQQVVAADMLMQLQDAVPSTLVSSEFKGNDFARANILANMIRDGHEPEKAVEQTDKLLDPTNTAQRDANERILKQAIKDNDNQPMISIKDVGDVFENWRGSNPDADEATMIQVADDANDEYRRQFLLTGSSEVARNQALRLIKSKWGVSEVSGSRRLMMYPPEARYGDGSTEWVRKQLDADLKERGIEPDGVMLISDPITARTFSAGNPSYDLWHENDEGLFERIGRWQADPEAESKASAKREAERVRREKQRAMDEKSFKDRELETAKRELAEAQRIGNPIMLAHAQAAYNRLTTPGSELSVADYALGDD